MTGFLRLSCVAVCLTYATASMQAEAAPKDDRPNIVIVMTDDQGYGDIAAHGNPFVSTPNLDAIRARSARFSDFHVDPTCSPTRAALMTGQHSLRAGVWHTVMGRSLLPTEHVTLAEAFSIAGYRTGIFGKWHLGDNFPYRPEDQGFDQVVIHGGGGVGQTNDYWGNTQFDDVYYKNGEPTFFAGNATDVWFNEAEEFIFAQKDAPLLAYIAPNAPHRPWRAPAHYVQPYLDAGLPAPMAKFYAMITHVDERIGNLKKRLDADSNGRPTIFIFLTDNGSAFSFKEEYLEGPTHDVVQRLTEATRDGEWRVNADMRGYKTSVYDGGHRVPLFISGPGIIENAEIDVLAAHYDIFPTLLELANIDSAAMDFDGVSLVPFLSGEQQERDQLDRAIIITNQRVFTPRIGRPAAVATKKWRYVVEKDIGYAALFDIETDPEQSNNVANDNPDVVRDMERHLKAWWKKAKSTGFPTQYIPVGDPGLGEARLTAMDWMEAPTTTAVPWFPGFQTPGKEIIYNYWLGREAEFEPLPWYVRAGATGSYRIDLLKRDRPAADPIGRKFAILEIDKKRFVQPVHGYSNAARFVVDMSSGKHSIKGWFADDPEASPVEPAMFSYVEHIESK